MQILKGEIFTYDKASGIVVLRAPAKDNRFKLQFLSEKHIQVEGYITYSIGSQPIMDNSLAPVITLKLADCPVFWSLVAQT